MNSIQRVLVALVILALVLDTCQSAGNRKRLCRMKKKKGECVDIIPRKLLRKYKSCPNFDVATLGRCAKAKGKCTLIETAKGRKICECIEPGRLFRDQPRNTR